MKQWFGDLTHDIVLRMVRGKPNYGASDDYAEGEARRYKKTMRDFMSLFGSLILAGSDTTMITLIWKERNVEEYIHRDGRVWSDPHEFKPGRFLTSHRDVDVKGQNSEFIPFGKISIGLTNLKATPLKVLLTRRLETKLYEDYII
ncbi:hypothetical protein PHAVU_002G022800 [Phaseolus vulgaris]|uniref:Uncharacterized protein n=1 Tax=Phaseolus vulgaris TaxID=3885 RepID=V7CHT3_PHAVU|nr:hypothetical protein PHAVU_002G022800g [Phaseolus vulgaris]ESW28845.1 hypothetical protein PHAVU_002G022800g [Phaseolus vulgaris]